MSFPIPIASVLTGATIPQLAYWRRHTNAAPPLLVPQGKRSGRYLYSWADVVALRSIVYLRQEKSLPRIRRAVATLRGLEAENLPMLEVLAPFETRSGRPVPALERPRPRIAVNPKVLGGYPVIAGTRVPFDVVASLAEDDLGPREIAAVYPSIDQEAIGDAVSFAEQVTAVA
jgi:uncharacterized protein (DUF433 family)